MNWVSAGAAVVALVIGIVIGWGVASIGGPSQGSLAAENEELKRKNTLLEQQVEEVNAKFLNNFGRKI